MGQTNNMGGQMNKLLLSMTMILFCGCASVTMYHEAFPPKAASEQIDIYRTQTPNREYIEIAQISFDDGFSAQDDLNTVVKKAKEIGADAIIITGGSRIKYNGSSAHEDGVKAIAIKYKE
jgi:hypothetical protein